jgi:hypothetical protein
VLKIYRFEQKKSFGEFFRIRARNLPEPFDGKTFGIDKNNGITRPKAGNSCDYA